MIQWMDFTFDEFLGPLLQFPEDTAPGFRTRSETVMEDGSGQNQETGQVQRPARMVGHPESELDARIGMDAARTDALRLGEVG